MSVAQRIMDIEAEMNRTQRNKATMNHLGVLKVCERAHGDASTLALMMRGVLACVCADG
jgi:hypothetical protein